MAKDYHENRKTAWHGSKIQALLEFQLFCKFNYGFIAFLSRLCYAENRKQRAAQQCVFVRGIYIHYKSNSFIRHIQRRNEHDLL